MKIQNSFTFLVVLGLVTCASNPFNDVPGRYIVELDHGDAATEVSDNFDIFVQHQIESDVFSGFSFDVRNENSTTLQDLRALRGVKNAWKATYVTLDAAVKEKRVDYSQLPYYNPHQMTGVDELHDQGYLGDGIVVAVVDTGADSSHPALAGKILGGYDFTLDKNNPGTDYTDCDGHGTFVSSIIVSDTSDMVGVAPNSRLKIYKVFECSSTTTSDLIMAGLSKAYVDGPDIINLSAGRTYGYSNDPVSLLASRIAETIPIFIAAGNSGVGGTMFSSSTGAAGKGVLAVGAAQGDYLYSWPVTAISSSGESYSFSYALAFRFDLVGTVDIDFIGNACFVSSLGKTGTGNKFLLANRGSCSDSDILQGLNEQEYLGALLFVTNAELQYLYTDFSDAEYTLYIALITEDVRTWIMSQTASGNSIQVTFPDDYTSSLLLKSQTTQFSSWGPTFENNFYPHIMAPGGQVLGADIQISGSYVLEDGTSFASPYAAGVAALYLSAFPGVDVQVLRNKLIGASRMMFQQVWSNDVDLGLDTGALAPSIQQGNGLLSARNLFFTKTKILSEPYLECNDTNNFVGTHTITFINEGDTSVNYEINYWDLSSVYTRDASTWFVASYYPLLVDGLPNAGLSQNLVTLGPGESTSIVVEVYPPLTLDNDQAPVYEGTFIIHGDNGDVVSVPYMGIIADTNDWTPWIESPYLSGTMTLFENVTDSGRDYTPSKSDSPYIFYNIRYGTEEYSFDLVDKDYQLSDFLYPPAIGVNGYLGPILVVTSDDQSLTLPLEFTSIFTDVLYVKFTTFADGTVFPTGRYKILFRALKTFGDKAKNEGWQLFLSDEFNVLENSDSSLVSSSSSNLSSSSLSSSSLSSSSLSSSSLSIYSSSSSFELSSGFASSLSSTESTSLPISLSTSSYDSNSSGWKSVAESSRSSFSISSTLSEGSLASVSNLSDFGVSTTSSDIISRGMSSVVPSGETSSAPSGFSSTSTTNETVVLSFERQISSLDFSNPNSVDSKSGTSFSVPQSLYTRYYNLSSLTGEVSISSQSEILTFETSASRSELSLSRSSPLAESPTSLSPPESSENSSTTDVTLSGRSNANESSSFAVTKTGEGISESERELEGNWTEPNSEDSSRSTEQPESYKSANLSTGNADSRVTGEEGFNSNTEGELAETTDLKLATVTVTSCVDHSCFELTFTAQVSISTSVFGDLTTIISTYYCSTSEQASIPNAVAPSVPPDVTSTGASAKIPGQVSGYFVSHLSEARPLTHNTNITLHTSVSSPTGIGSFISSGSKLPYLSIAPAPQTSTGSDVGLKSNVLTGSSTVKSVGVSSEISYLSNIPEVSLSQGSGSMHSLTKSYLYLFMLFFLPTVIVVEL
ncbi:CIC11C00000002450 [Sungouiella intermedia]|uniref:CIC11C00000002450 n=1 Tax=Sungouiella intermedia TaxID=45354 RepID=A0A1L0BTY5_9ASCO|nr:CIC11C00000002450 [[Candida] intermedia]